MKLLLASIALLALSVTPMAYGEPITVIRTRPPGSANAQWADGIAKTLTKNGIENETQGFKNCNEAARYIKENPLKPIVVMDVSYPIIQGIINPQAPDACHIPVTASSLIAVAIKYNHIICGHNQATMGDLLASKKPKIGVLFNTGIQTKIIREQMADLGVKDARIVSYSLNSDLVQGYSAGDLDYLVTNAEFVARSLTNTSCFGTSADINKAKATGRTSYSSINGHIRHENSGMWALILGFNVNTAPLYEALGPNGDKDQQLTFLQQVAEIPKETPSQQFALFQEMVESLRDDLK